MKLEELRQLIRRELNESSTDVEDFKKNNAKRMAGGWANAFKEDADEEDAAFFGRTKNKVLSETGDLENEIKDMIKNISDTTNSLDIEQITESIKRKIISECTPPIYDEYGVPDYLAGAPLMMGTEKGRETVQKQAKILKLKQRMSELKREAGIPPTHPQNLNEHFGDGEDDGPTPYGTETEYDTEREYEDWLKNNPEELDERRFQAGKRRTEELENNIQIQKFVNAFNKIRNKQMANVEIEKRPVFSKVRVEFVDKSSGPGMDWDTHQPSGMGKEDYKSGQITISYNDTTCYFEGEPKGNVILYKFLKSHLTKHNPPMSREGKELAVIFKDMCKGFRFTLTKEEVPSRFYHKSETMDEIDIVNQADEIPGIVKGKDGMFYLAAMEGKYVREVWPPSKSSTRKEICSKNLGQMFSKMKQMNENSIAEADQGNFSYIGNINDACQIN